MQANENNAVTTPKNVAEARNIVPPSAGIVTESGDYEDAVYEDYDEKSSTPTVKSTSVDLTIKAETTTPITVSSSTNFSLRIPSF